MTLDEFLNRTRFPNNMWIEFETLRLYLRKTRRCIFDKKVLSLDVANFTNHGVNGQGLYRTWDNMVKQKVPEYGFDGIYIENVLNPWLAEVLERYSYTRLEGPGNFINSYCFWWECPT
jgi:hypothetical protein